MRFSPPPRPFSPCYYDMFMDQMNSNCVLQQPGWDGERDGDGMEEGKRFHRSAWLIGNIENRWENVET